MWCGVCARARVHTWRSCDATWRSCDATWRSCDATWRSCDATWRPHARGSDPWTRDSDPWIRGSAPASRPAPAGRGGGGGVKEQKVRKSMKKSCKIFKLGGTAKVVMNIVVYQWFSGPEVQLS